MPFYFYKHRRLTNGATEFSNPAQTSKVPAALQENAKPTDVSRYPHPWDVSSDGIVSRLGRDPAVYKLVIDLKPDVPRNVSLYELSHVYGFTYERWTPIAVRLVSLFVDHDHDDPETFKATFSDEGCRRDCVREFLYLRTTQRGTWAWGRAGFVNGTLLFPDAWDYFSRVL